MFKSEIFYCNYTMDSDAPSHNFDIKLLQLDNFRKMIRPCLAIFKVHGTSSRKHVITLEKHSRKHVFSSQYFNVRDIFRTTNVSC